MLQQTFRQQRTPGNVEESDRRCWRVAAKGQSFKQISDDATCFADDEVATLLCLIAPGLGFGPLMVVGTHVALTGSYSGTALVASLVPFFLVNNLLLLNQFPDAQADARVGRRHILVTSGPAVAARYYTAFAALAFVSLTVAVLAGLLPAGALLGLLTLALALPTMRDVRTHALDIQQLLPAMGRNVLLAILTPVLMATGMLMS